VALGLVGGEAREDVRERLWVADRNDHAGLPDGLGVAGAVGHDDGEAVAHRLEHGERLALAQRGHHKDVGGGEQRLGVVAVAEDAHRRSGLCSYLPLERTVAGDEQDERSARGGGRVGGGDRRERVLARLELADEQRNDGLGCEIELLAGVRAVRCAGLRRCRRSVGDDDQAGAQRAGEDLGELVAFGLRGADRAPAQGDRGAGGAAGEGELGAL
jgi:hypothetical protein